MESVGTLLSIDSLKWEQSPEGSVVATSELGARLSGTYGLGEVSDRRVAHLHCLQRTRRLTQLTPSA